MPLPPHPRKIAWLPACAGIALPNATLRTPLPPQAQATATNIAAMSALAGA